MTLYGENNGSFTWCVSPSLLWLCIMLLRSLCMDCTVIVSGSLSVVDRAPNCRYLYKTQYKYRVHVSTCTSVKTQKIKYITEVPLSKYGTIHTSPNTVYTYTYMLMYKTETTVHAIQYFAKRIKKIQANIIHLCDHKELHIHWKYRYIISILINNTCVMCQGFVVYLAWLLLINVRIHDLITSQLCCKLH